MFIFNSSKDNKNMTKGNSRLSAVLALNERIVKNRKYGYCIDNEIKRLQDIAHKTATYTQHLNDCNYHSNASDCSCGLLDILQIINQFKQP